MTKYVKSIKFSTSGETYVIRDAEQKSRLDTLEPVVATKADSATVDAALAGKQATLVSGENIKTINNQSILGSGNITIGGSGGTTDYDQLDNRPQIAGTTLTGNKSLADLGIAAASDLSGKQDKLTSANAGNNVQITEVEGVVKISATGGGSGSANWGSIGGTLSDQTDLQNALNAKAGTDNLKTINRESLVGSGDIELLTSTDLANYYTKTEADAEFLTSSDIGTMATEDKDDYYTKTAADAEFLTSNLGAENNGKFLKVGTDGSATFDYPTADPSMVEGAIEESCTNGYISQVYSKEEKFIIPTETSELVPDSDIKDKGFGGNASYEQVGATVSWGTGKSQVHGYIDVEEGDVYDVTWKCQNSSHQGGYYTGIVLTGDDAVVKVDAVTSYPAYATTTTTRVIIPSGMNITRLYFCSTQTTTNYPTSDTRIEKITQSTTTKTIAKTKDYGNYELIEAINNAALGGATTSTVGETLSFGSETDIVHGYVDVKPNETYLVGLVYDSDDGTRGIYATDENNKILYSFNDLCIVTGRTVGKTSQSTTSGAQMPCNSIIKVVLPSDSTIKRLWVCTGINNIVYPTDGFFINKWVSKDYSVYKEEMEGLSELYVGTPETWINGASDSGGYIVTSASDYRYYGRISNRDIVSYPTSCYKKLTIHLTKGFIVAFRTGCRGGGLNNNCYWFKDGDTFTIPDHCNYYALTMSKVFDPGPITEAATGERSSFSSVLCPMYPSDFENACLRITYEKVNNEVSSKNDDVLSNARAKRTDTSPWNQLTYYPVIAHTSDCHGDLQRVKNFFDYCDTHNIDCACVTGDIVGDRYDNRLDWFHDIVNSHSVFPAVCMGNHDVTAGQSGLTISDQDAYNNLFGGIADKVKNTTGKTWYYTDLTDKSLRVISVNLFQYGGSNRSYAHFTEEQLNWFCSTLLSTPENYGIIVLTHAPLLALQKDNNHTTFWQRLRNSDSVYQNGVTGYPIYDIVDAFISGKSDFSKTWSQTGEPSSVSVTADFSGKNTGVEFIAHLTGHLHEDSICYVPTTSERTQKQLMLNVITTNSMYGGTGYHWLTDCSDCARDCCTESGNAFNVYVIDRDTKKVKVIRIGNNIIEGMAERKYMEIPYAD